MSRVRTLSAVSLQIAYHRDFSEPVLITPSPDDASEPMNELDATDLRRTPVADPRPTVSMATIWDEFLLVHSLAGVSTNPDPRRMLSRSKKSPTLYPRRVRWNAGRATWRRSRS